MATGIYLPGQKVRIVKGYTPADVQKLVGKPATIRKREGGFYRMEEDNGVILWPSEWIIPLGSETDAVWVFLDMFLCMAEAANETDSRDAFTHMQSMPDWVLGMWEMSMSATIAEFHGKVSGGKNEI